jgi:hypothetical protein
VSRVALLVAVAACVAGCGGGGKSDKAAGRHAVDAVTTARVHGDVLSLPYLGEITASCQTASAYVIRFRAAADYATDSVRIVANGRELRRARVDPGRVVSVRVATLVHRRGGETFHDTPLVTWKIEQETQPTTIGASVSMVLSDGTQGGDACTFAKTRARLTTRRH